MKNKIWKSVTFKTHLGHQVVCLPLSAVSRLVSVLLASNVLGLIPFVCLLDDCHRAKALIIDLQTFITWSLVNFQYLGAGTHSLQPVIKPFVLSYNCNCFQGEPKPTGQMDRRSSLSESNQRLQLEIHSRNQHCIRCMPCCDLMMRALMSDNSCVFWCPVWKSKPSRKRWSTEGGNCNTMQGRTNHFTCNTGLSNRKQNNVQAWHKVYHWLAKSRRLYLLND